MFIHGLDCALLWCRLSFATDVARGMSYLHQHKLFHGRLHSRNCIIDDRWVCKISGNNSPTTATRDWTSMAPIWTSWADLAWHITALWKRQGGKVHPGTLWPTLWLLVLDYGLAFYRKEEFGGGSHDFNYGDINRVYIAPEVMLGSSSNMTPAADVYRCDGVYHSSWLFFLHIKKNLETESCWYRKC